MRATLIRTVHKVHVMRSEYCFSNLVYIEQALGDDLHGEVFLQLVLIDSILSLFDARHVVAHVPHVNLAVRLVTELTTRHEQ